MTFISFVYLVCGLVLFCFILIKQLKSFDVDSVSYVARVVEFYKWHLDVVLILLNFASCGFRILGFLFIFLLAGKLKEIQVTFQKEFEQKSEYGEQFLKRENAINKTEYSDKEENCLNKRSSDSSNNQGNINTDEEGINSRKFSSEVYYKKILK